MLNHCSSNNRRIRKRAILSTTPLAFFWCFFFVLFCIVIEKATPTPSSEQNLKKSSHTFSVQIPGRRWDIDGSDSCINSSSGGWTLGGLGREFNLFDNTRRGEGTSSSSSSSSTVNEAKASTASSTHNSQIWQQHPKSKKTKNKLPSISYGGAIDEGNNDGNSAVRLTNAESSGSGLDMTSSSFPASSSIGSSGLGSSSSSITSGGSSSTSGSSIGSSSSGTTTYSTFKKSKNKNNRSPFIFRSVHDWWVSSITPNIKNWPKIQCRVEPTTTLKIRKTFRPLKTIVIFGADFNTQLGVWQFQSSWEDTIIGGKIQLAGRELQISKSWQLSVGAVEDLITRLRFRAAVDLSTWKAYARVGFRTERLTPLNIMEGFTLIKHLPLDGANKGHVKLEVKANFALPEPEIEYSTESNRRSLVGMGDIEVNLDEMNLLLDY